MHAGLHACVCVSVCVECFSCSRINEKFLHAGFYSHDFNSWICNFVLELWLGLLTWNAIVAFSCRTVRSETCPWGVAILYLVVSSALER